MCAQNRTDTEPINPQVRPREVIVLYGNRPVEEAIEKGWAIDYDYDPGGRRHRASTNVLVQFVHNLTDGREECVCLWDEGSWNQMFGAIGHNMDLLMKISDEKRAINKHKMNIYELAQGLISEITKDNVAEWLPRAEE